MSTQRLTVISFGDPEAGRHGSGERMLSSMFADQPDLVVRRTVLTHRKDPARVDWSGGTADLVPIPRVAIPGVAMIPMLGDRLDARSQRFARSAVTTMESLREASDVWVVLNEPTCIHLADELTRRRDESAGRLVVSVWDTPQWLAHQRGLSPRRRRGLLAAFERVVRSADDVVVVSERMAEQFNLAWGTSATVMRPVPGIASADDDAGPLSTELRAHVAFAGSLYSRHEWHALLDAVQNHNDLADAEHAIAVTCIGSLGRRTRRRSWVRHLDLLPEADAAEHLRAATVGYLPYPRDPRTRSMLAQTFPSKLGFYVACGLPVLFHGPADCAAADFIRRRDLGAVCDSNDPDDLLDAIGELSADPDRRARLADARGAVLADEFDPHTNRRLVLDILGRRR